MLDTLPRHVSDVQQAVNTAQIYECTIVGQVLNDTFNRLTFLQVSQQLFTFLAVSSFQNGTTGNNHVVTLGVELDHFEFQLFTFQVQGVTYRTDINQRTWQEGADVFQFNSEATFDLTVDNTHNHFVSFEGFFQLFPAFSTLGFFTRQFGFTEAIFYSFQRNVSFVTDFNFQFTFFIQELAAWDYSF